MAVPMLHLQQLKNGCHSGCVLVPADGGSGHQLPRMWLADRMMGLVFLALSASSNHYCQISNASMNLSSYAYTADNCGHQLLWALLFDPSAIKQARRDTEGRRHGSGRVHVLYL